MKTKTWAVPTALVAVASALATLIRSERARWRVADEAQRIRRRMRQARAPRARRRRRASARRVTGHFH